ncbi:diaminohydroxyphosphoribosylaminopyrimidine deaminase/5-amino-6-(5-phosphoribosylamino)uracil reductase [Parabacteroides sp. PF5-5]|uniref:bifunctional diaminohydroxyphosphoribosylaminopyrimidine deaminase/5-amino-6-(5-phosphoribosylamino)uracil reductase RibD n=1 Tax=unclassified Parabacteroides TaxID=2649774 RepID=UPI002474C8B5|nr:MULTISPECIES: bifunctional diaminohydroxyphosphoribosylaminopyrimidine deaminase/5-amino-6-(5-phosphoribosylamino)uracil reductase RibD [unclassified Parabacteroides]MDH6306085.1 diaminohydroxyphosphoribosylaminopyrimidine deaminase/5-amino-6-(5-phosphoribosylamino)uracil reductase [Parabacteroides sp. PH5-39]MDH6317017.1 diaminohydroxyphosphoribosylaminopyrimidine deaminase/5-amino-6-(5-phosphoribosylamino)uracil reductase [Parabacteroides sp. PF5-13]MDH6320770.1 diaminohydroxyphosphoribosyl
MIPIEDKYMLRCLELARHGEGKVSPNPLVGSVIVHQGKIIGEGFHRKYGEAHAEVNAIASVRDERLLKNATLYVNLEPCSHYGKTPPCSELIIRKQIPRVVVGCLDPNPVVSGNGIRMLQEAGTEVVTGVMQEASYEANKVFMTSMHLKRPYIYLKWAQSSDGFIDRMRKDASERPVTLSSPEMLQRIHKKRAETDAIMVGTRTALLDNPSLNVRYWSGKSPVRIALDRELSIPAYYHLLNGDIPTLLYSGKEKENNKNVEYVNIDYSADVLKQVLADLHRRRLNSLLVEGGAYLLNHFLQAGLWDEVQIETAAIALGEGVKAPAFKLQKDIVLKKVSFGIDENGKEHVVTVYSRKNQL